MNIRTPAAAKVQHGFESLSPEAPAQVKSHDERLVLNVRNPSDFRDTHHSSVTKHSASPTGHNKDKLSRRTQCSIKPSHRNTSPEDITMTCARIEAYLGSETLHQLRIPSIHLTYLWSANVDPPVTARSLGELDLVRIINDAKLRHDLNFEREISFRPNVYGPRSQQKEAIANAYWQALTTEFALYIKLRHNINSNPPNVPSLSALPWLSELRNSHQVHWRLPRMFATIRDILKTLVPASDCFVVDERLDVALLMQELENGVCDVKGLSDWLQRLLLGSCSPIRDTEVERMVAVVHEGIDKSDARILVDGLKVLFGILETMKLDVANHQIRYLRLLMVEDSIHFEQNTFLRRIVEGFDVRDAQDWFDYQLGEEVDGYMSFTRGVWDMIVDGRSGFPATFCHDTDRLLALQHQFNLELFQDACSQVFVDTLHRLGWTSEPSYEAYNRVVTRAVAIFKDGQQRRSPGQYNREVALEIVREAYSLCSLTELPDERLVNFSRLHLEDAIEPTSSVFQRLHGRLSFELAELMDEEVEVLMDLTPLQMLNYLNPGPVSTQSSGQSGMVNIAKRAAHIAVLHWKIWGPILYEQPRHNMPTPLERPSSSNVLSLVGLTPQGTLASVVEDGPRPGSSRRSSTEAVIQSKDSRSRSTTDTSSEQG